jgi:arylsulfatase
MKPKTFPLSAFILGLTFCLPVFLTSCLKVGDRPNIILIMSDDMGFSDIGCYGGEINTPNLDKLAFEGVRFTQFYNTARCCPTRASLLTGLHPHQAGIGEMTNDRGVDGYRGDLNEHCVTIAQVLKGAGYKNYMAGKWHVTKHIKPEGPKYNWPLQRGFDRFYGTIIGAGSYFDPTTLCRDNTFITPANDPEYKPERYYYTNAITDNAIKYLDEHYSGEADKPFFMYVAFTAAHWPMHALPEDIARYDGWYDDGYDPVREARLEKMIELGILPQDSEMSPAVWNWEERPHQQWESDMMEVYAAMIDCMDRGIGKIVKTLEDQGTLDNTLIFFLQDNGACAENWLSNIDPSVYDTIDYQPMGRDELQTRIWPPMQTRDGRPVIPGPAIDPGPANTYPLYDAGWANTSNTPFRYFKHWIHEGGISTPLIVYWPEGIKAKGKITGQLGQLTDIMATIVDAAGADYPATLNDIDIYPMEGVSLIPSLDGEEFERPPLFWEHIGKQGVRVDNWKLVAAAGRKNPIPLDAWELYDIDNDRSELHNLAGEYPDRVKEMARLWEEWAHRAMVYPYSKK